MYHMKTNKKIPSSPAVISAVKLIYPATQPPRKHPENLTYKTSDILAPKKRNSKKYEKIRKLPTVLLASSTARSNVRRDVDESRQ